VNNIWLKRAVVGAAVILFCTARLGAQADTMVFARMAGWNAPTFHFLDIVQTRGRLVLPDIGYVDFGRSNYRELYGVGGLVVYPGKHFSWIQECYFVRSLGRVANGASYLQPWTFVAYSIPQTRFLGETLYFTYLPLNQAGRIQYVLDRAKLERDYRRFKVGAGYAGYQFAQASWQNRPFVTATIKAGGLGSLEFWLQRLPGTSVQFQLRYAVLFHRAPGVP
jgi:hypothetical protein